MGDEYRGREKLIKCPFNPSHQIIPHRMAGHIARCKKQYPDAQVATCPFNNTHIEPSHLLAAHLEECPDREIADREIYRRKSENTQDQVKLRTELPEAPKAPIVEEDWSDEICDASFDPEIYAFYNMRSTRKPPSGMGKAARQLWRDLEIQRVTKLLNGESLEELKIEYDHLLAGRGTSKVAGSAKSTEEIRAKFESLTTGPISEGACAAIQDDDYGASAMIRNPTTLQTSRPRVAAAFRTPMKNLEASKGQRMEETVREDETARQSRIKLFIKDKRTLEKRLVEINRLLEKEKQGYRLNPTQQMKVCRKNETEMALKKLFEFNKDIVEGKE